MRTDDIAVTLLTDVFELLVPPKAPNGIEVPADMTAKMFLQGLLASKVYVFKPVETRKKEIIEILEKTSKDLDVLLKTLKEESK